MLVEESEGARAVEVVERVGGAWAHGVPPVLRLRLLHEYVHATRRSQVVAKWAAALEHPLVEGIVELQTRAMVVQGHAGLRISDLTWGPYSKEVHGVVNLCDEGAGADEATVLLRAADRGVQRFRECLEGWLQRKGKEMPEGPAGWDHLLLEAFAAKPVTRSYLTDWLGRVVL